MKIQITLLFVSLCFTFYGQTKTDHWYKFQNESITGYLHQIIQEDSISIDIISDIKLKLNESSIIYLNSKLVNKKDTLLTVKSLTFCLLEVTL